MAVTIYIEGQRLDTYENDSITIVSNVKDVKDLSLKADFSQSFSVPASNTNNRIFEDWYNFDVINGFDARTRKDATIDIDTLDYKRGKISLNKVDVKNGFPESYNITFYGIAIQLKDLLGDDKLFDLDWLDNFNHDYTDTNVKTGLTTGLNFTVDSVTYTAGVIYPMVSYKRQWLYNSDVTDTTSTDTLVNIAYDAGRTDGIDYLNLKPAIKLDIIFKAIQEKYGLTFTGNFFDTDRWLQLYMNLNNEADTLVSGILEYENVTGTIPNSGLFYQQTLKYEYRATITPAVGFESVEYKIKMYSGSEVIYESQSFLTGTEVKTAVVTFDMQDDDFEYDLRAEVISQVDFDFEADQRLRYRYLGLFASPSYTTVSNNNYPGLSVDLDTVITTLIPDIKVYEFMQSIIRMFNLVVVPDGTDLYFNDLPSWYTEGQIYDVTPYIDTETKTVKRGVIYNQINFSFEESDQILSDFFREANNRGYGDIEFRLYEDAAQTIPVQGDKLEIEVIFENAIYERLFDLDDNSETSIQYCLMLDKNLNRVVGNPILFYAPSIDVSTNTLGFLESASTYTELSASVFMPSHAQQMDTPSFNVNFNAEINEYESTVFPETMYKVYYDDFISDVFSIQRRIIEVKGELPVNLLHRLELNDRIIINDTRYIINKISSNLVKRNGQNPDKLELINDIYDAPLPTDEVNTSLFRQSARIYTSREVSDTVNYIGLDNKTASKVDAGDGTTWVTITSPKSVGVTSEIAFTIDENTSGLEREMYIQVTDGLKDPSFTIVQNA